MVDFVSSRQYHAHGPMEDLPWSSLLQILLVSLIYWVMLLHSRQSSWWVLPRYIWKRVSHYKQNSSQMKLVVKIIKINSWIWCYWVDATLSLQGSIHHSRKACLWHWHWAIQILPKIRDFVKKIRGGRNCQGEGGRGGGGVPKMASLMNKYNKQRNRKSEKAQKPRTDL